MGHLFHGPVLRTGMCPVLCSLLRLGDLGHQIGVVRVGGGWRPAGDWSSTAMSGMLGNLAGGLVPADWSFDWFVGRSERDRMPAIEGERRLLFRAIIIRCGLAIMPAYCGCLLLPFARLVVPSSTIGRPRQERSPCVEGERFLDWIVPLVPPSCRSNSLSISPSFMSLALSSRNRFTFQLHQLLAVSIYIVRFLSRVDRLLLFLVSCLIFSLASFLFWRRDDQAAGATCDIYQRYY